MKLTTMKHRVVLNSLSGLIHSDFNDLREVIDLTEQYLKKEAARLEKRVNKELEGLSNEEEKEATIGWYADDFNRLDKVYPIIQRRALFITLMCMTEANLLRACRMCRSAYEIPKEFKKKGKERLIAQSLSYLQDHLTIRDKQLKPHWEFLQDLWTIRNGLVHNDGKPKSSELNKVSQFCASIPTFELDHHNRIILKEESVQMALRRVELFFMRLLAEIRRNKLPS